MRIRSFRSILDECLTALQQGACVETCLSRYPKQAERLRSLLTLAQRVSQTPPAALRPWAQRTSWEMVRQQVVDLRQGRRFHFNISWGWLRPVAIAASLFLALGLTTGGLAYAARDSLPGSSLYRVKLITEDVRLWVAFDDSERAEILLNQSDERTEEIKELIQRGKPVPGSVLAALRDRNSRAAGILKDRPQEAALLARMLQQSAAQEEMLVTLWDQVAASAHDEYSQAVATLHNTRLRSSGAVDALTQEDLAGGVLNVSGTAELVSEGVWRVGGVEVSIDERTIGPPNLQPGSTAKVVAARGADGRLQALSLSTIEASVPRSETVVSGALEEVGDGEVLVAGNRISITAETLLQLKLQPGRQVEIVASSGADGAVASTVKPADTGAGTAAPLTLAYEGAIEGEVNAGGQTNEWTIGGQTFVITPATVVDAQGGAAKSGARARVEAINQDGHLLAQRVTILAADAKPETVHLTGVFQGIQGGHWLISGLAVESQEKAPAPAMGSIVAVSAEPQESRIIGHQTVVLEPSGQGGLTRLQGLIAAIDGDVWIVGFAHVRVGKETTVSGKPLVGARALVWARQGSDKGLEATYVYVLDERSIIAEQQ